MMRTWSKSVSSEVAFFLRPDLMVGRADERATCIVYAHKRFRAHVSIPLHDGLPHVLASGHIVREHVDRKPVLND